MKTPAGEIKRGQRFAFGKNWQRFLSTLTDDRIAIAEKSILDMLRVDSLGGKTVLDIGSGSGLFSLAARRLGAEVRSFDYDPWSVDCTRELRSRYRPDDGGWSISEGSVLDRGFLASLGRFDVVYTWGVLHHTGDLWGALENAASLVNEKGTLFIAIYNDQGRVSGLWKGVKKCYCSGLPGKALVCSVFIPQFWVRVLASCVLRREDVFAAYRKHRGMSITHDWCDWLGGLPFEVASVGAVFTFLRDRGFLLSNVETTNGRGNNQFVFVRASQS
jgi:SAM-dependent methyltransferase